MDLSFLVVVVIVTALVFDFTNGFHDTANAMATSIATGALKPKVAVALSAVLNLVGAFVSTEVAKTISSGIVDDAKVTVPMIFGGLVGAILWNLLTWYVGLPSSSSHALFGGLIGATWIAAGSGAVHFGTVVQKIIVPADRGPDRGRRGRAARNLPGLQDHRASAEEDGRTTGSGSGRSRPRRWSRSRTAPATRRRRWASSRWC